jgi:hypothetical protein
MALPLGAWFNDRGAAGGVDRGGRRGGGLLAVLTLRPTTCRARRTPGGAGHRHRHLPGCAAACVAISRLLPPKAARWCGRVGSAACFGFASAMARLVVAGNGDLLIPLLACGFFAVTGMLMIQAAYRDGGWARRWPRARSSTRSPPRRSGSCSWRAPALGVAGGALGFAGLAPQIVGLTVLARHAHHPPKTRSRSARPLAAVTPDRGRTKAQPTPAIRQGRDDDSRVAHCA